MEMAKPGLEEETRMKVVLEVDEVGEEELMVMCEGQCDVDKVRSHSDDQMLLDVFIVEINLRQALEEESQEYESENSRENSRELVETS